MAATVRNLRSAIRAKKEREAAKARWKKPPHEGMKLAGHLLDHYTLPAEETDKKPLEDEVE